MQTDGPPDSASGSPEYRPTEQNKTWEGGNLPEYQPDYILEERLVEQPGLPLEIELVRLPKKNNHNALDDATAQGNLLIEILKS